MPGPGRWTESLPAGACPGTGPAGTTAPRPAPGTPGGAGGTGGAVHGATCQTGGGLNRDSRNTPVGPERHLRINKEIYSKDTEGVFIIYTNTVLVGHVASKQNEEMNRVVCFVSG